MKLPLFVLYADQHTFVYKFCMVESHYKPGTTQGIYN